MYTILSRVAVVFFFPFGGEKKRKKKKEKKERKTIAEKLSALDGEMQAPSQ